MISVPAYNGGLFDPEKHPDLARWTIGDSRLAEAIDLLSRSEAGGNGNGGGKGFVDYSTLEIRHLGSIYEGLLEYTLAVAEEDLVVSSGRDRKWVPLAEFNRGKKSEKGFEEFGEFDRARAGDLYLTTDRGERKATGSYYTPDYIVDYIVEKTVGPVVEERWKEALLENRSLIEATLSVKVLDPAMGSGHFLVGAVEFLAGKLMRAAERDIEWGWVEDRGQFTNEWAKREAVSHSVYGVDLNDLAVELAKVSLWLITIAKDKPLSFLDHRLKQGNSLVGARLSDLIHYPGERAKAVAQDQVTLPSLVSPRFLQHLIGKIRELEEIGDDSLSEIKRKEKVFEEFRNLPEYTKARAIANVHTAVYFGNEVEARTTPSGTKAPDQVYHDLFWAVGGDDAEWRKKTSPAWFGEAQRIAGDKSFFHWQLEFPEVFFAGGAARENPGWDAVVGNPPYVRQEELGEFKGYFEDNYRVYHGIADLYVYFFERGHQLLRQGGDFGFISSNKFMRSNYGKPLREFLRDGINIKEIVDFGELPVFPEAATFPAIYLTANEYSDYPTTYTQIKSLNFELLETVVNERGIHISSDGFAGENWSLRSVNDVSIMRKMESLGIPLGDYVDGEIKCGIKTGLNEAFFIDSNTRKQLISEDTKSEEIIKPIIVGDDIKKYAIDFKDKYLICTYMDINIGRYPAIKRHLESYKAKLEARWDKGNYWYELRACSYYDDFGKPKIVIPAFALEPKFSIDNGEYFVNNPAYLIPRNDFYLLSLLNSKLCFRYLLSICSVLGDEGNRGRAILRTVYYKTLPIRRISFTTPEDDRRRLAETLSGLCAAGQFEKVLRVLDDCLPKDERGEFVAEGERSDVVHDLLAHLAEEMIRMNKEKQEEIRGFLAWLEEFCGAKVDDLSNKTKVSAYYEI